MSVNPPKVAVVTDTDSSLPLALAEQYGVLQAPITINFGNETFETTYEIDDRAVFKRIDRENRIPTTAAPTPGRWAKTFQQAFDNGAEEIVCLTISSKVSATYATALQAAELFPGRQISVVDTLQLSINQGFMVMAAAEAARAGAAPAEIIASAQAAGQRAHLFAALATLKYLAMSGRVSYLAAGMGTILNVKPILTIIDGRLDVLEKVRTQHKAWERVIELCENTAAGKTIERLAVFHVAAETEAHAFEQLLRQRLACSAETIYCELTPGLSVHSGAGLVGASLLTAS